MVQILMQIVFITALVILHSQRITGSLPPWQFNSTTPELREIIIGRCWEYQRLIQRSFQPNSSLAVDVDCEEVWRVLNETVAFKDPCTITAQSYDKFFELFDNGKNIEDQVMFWSGTREVVHDYTYVNRKFKTLEDTFPGYIANDLYWCSCPTCETGYNTHVKCGGSNNCNPNYQYWKKASKNLAEKASGIVHVMVNGTTKDNNSAYFNGSFFGKDELPTMGKLGKVKKLIVYNVFSLSTNYAREMCGTETLKQFFEDANKYNLTDIKCTDDPREVRYILCAKYPQASQCDFATEASGAVSMTTSMMLVFSMFMIVLF